MISNKNSLIKMTIFGGVHSRNVMNIPEENTIGTEEKE